MAHGPLRLQGRSYGGQRTSAPGTTALHLTYKLEQSQKPRHARAAQPVGGQRALNWDLFSSPLQQLCCRKRDRVAAQTAFLPALHLGSGMAVHLP